MSKEFSRGEFNITENEKLFKGPNSSIAENEMEKLAEKAADDGLIINEPNIFFDVEKSTGIAKVVMGDLREIGYEPFYEGPVATREQILDHNQKILKGHLDRLKQLAEEAG